VVGLGVATYEAAAVDIKVERFEVYGSGSGRESVRFSEWRWFID